MSPTVLVVEDDPSILAGLVEFLESEGYHAQKASNGQLALRLLDTADPLPSAIILDLMMPVMDGAQFREAQRRDARIADIPVVLISAAHRVQLQMPRLGNVQYLRKPIDIDELSVVLRRLLMSA